MNELINTDSFGNLIPITGNGKEVNARDLHAFLGSKRDFSTWIKDRIKSYDFIEGVDFRSFTEIVEREVGATTRIEYILSINMAKELSMLEGSNRGKQARQYFIACENITHTLLEQKAREQQKQIESITANNMELHNQITAQQPAVIFAESVANSNDTICMDDLAKLITQNGYIINRNELFAWMVKNGYLLRKSRRIGRKLVNDYSPSQEGARLRLFHLHPEHIKGLNCMRYTCKVTGKGQIYFVNKFRDAQNNR